MRPTSPSSVAEKSIVWRSRGVIESIRSASGTPKASVLPEPVGDLTRTSWPSRTSGTTMDWTANGVSNPRLARAPATGADTPRSANVEDIGELLLPDMGMSRGIERGWGDSTDPNRAFNKSAFKDKEPHVQPNAARTTSVAAVSAPDRVG